MSALKKCNFCLRLFHINDLTEPLFIEQRSALIALALNCDAVEENKRRPGEESP